ncbi:peptide deformylase [Enterobacteriaceae endosymbiont of Donacia cincticornis]|uniref:peptide deformylase n=1 Tax=Enterobacteriaceae endosymbiont of Donacia cincticornis TaxID=2675773 RepID=UPI0014498251|nr:peptide deformylase [Enterobacteriaceae endosymbiont of Donacia cincticornis]QJC36129.1 peptide deformylase [Enterobacteriaceae endosymbiont of Donacia cincticornis]
MSIMKLLYFPNKKLRKKARSIKKIDDNIKLLVNNMLKTMYFYNGIGLAATQIGINKKIIVIDITIKRNNPLILINPKIIVIDKSKISNKEGCLSIPIKQQYFILRYKKIKIKAKNLMNENIELEAKYLLSYCIQHEIDHLNGILFIDYLSNLKYQRIYDKIKKLNKKIIFIKKHNHIK